MIKTIDLTLSDFGEVSLEIDLAPLDPVIHALVADLEYGRFDDKRLQLGRPVNYNPAPNPSHVFQFSRAKLLDSPGHQFVVTLLQTDIASRYRTRPTPWGYAAYGTIVNGAELAEQIFTERIRTVQVARNLVHH